MFLRMGQENFPRAGYEDVYKEGHAGIYNDDEIRT